MKLFLYIIYIIGVLPGCLRAQSKSVNHHPLPHSSIYQIKVITESLIQGIYGKQIRRVPFTMTLLLEKDSSGAIVHLCLDNHGHSYNWVIKDSLLQIDWQDKTEKYLVFRYEQYLFLVPPSSKQAFLKEIISLKKRKLDFDKKLYKNKPYPRHGAFWIMANQYWVKEL